MNIPVILNGNKIVFDVQADEPLMNVLQKKGCSSVKCGCNEGSCGACTVLLEDKPVPSCKIPVGIIRDEKIVTLESFSKTNEYSLIMQGFEKAGIKMCGYCNSGKIFSAYQILKQNKNITRAEITEQVRHLAPCCTDLETLVNGIIYAISLKESKTTRTIRNARKR